MRLGHAGEKSLQTLARQGVLKGVGTCKLEFCEHCIIGKKTKVSGGKIWREVREEKSRSSVQIMEGNISQIISLSYVLMRA